VRYFSINILASMVHVQGLQFVLQMLFLCECRSLYVPVINVFMCCIYAVTLHSCRNNIDHVSVIIFMPFLIRIYASVMTHQTKRQSHYLFMQSISIPSEVWLEILQ
jgi:tryptophan-rich sensory protein